MLNAGPPLLHMGMLACIRRCSDTAAPAKRTSRAAAVAAASIEDSVEGCERSDPSALGWMERVGLTACLNVAWRVVALTPDTARELVAESILTPFWLQTNAMRHLISGCVDLLVYLLVDLFRIGCGRLWCNSRGSGAILHRRSHSGSDDSCNSYNVSHHASLPWHP